MRRILAVVVSLAVLAGAGGAGGEAQGPDDKVRRAAGQLLHGTDAEFASTRNELANWSAADLRALIDAARTQRFGAGSGLDILMPSAELMQTDESALAQAEGPLLAAATASPGSWRARVHAWPLRLEERHAARWLGAYAPPPNGAVRAVPAAYAQMLLRAAGQGTCVRREPWAPLVLADGQSGGLGAGSTFRYVQDFSLSGSMVMDIVEPVLGSLREGLRVGVIARRADRGVTLELDVEWSEVVRPMATFDSTFRDGGPKVTLQLPELRVMTLREVVRVPSHGWVLAVTGKPFPEGDGPGRERRLVLLHAEVLAR